MFHKFHVIDINDDLRDKVRGVGSETWKGCELDVNDDVERRV